ncbi:MAG: GNAT family N-acetyltransferase [Rhodobacteraceae bacterium]|nr:GNAT family N-acetyltransferase [Paracoccaceae bacterium]
MAPSTQKPESAPSIQIFAGSDEPALAVCREIRDRVFCQEQGVSPELEWDGLDGQCSHLLASVDGKALGTARVRVLENSQIGKIERVAVYRHVRGQGIGTRLTEAACQLLRTLACNTAALNAQVSARDFYAALGFKAQGEIFEDAGIPHIHMRKNLKP